MKTILTALLAKLMEIVLGMLSGEEMKKFCDFVLDKIEEYAIKSDNKVDDAVVLPLCKLIRSVFDISEYDT